MVLNRDPSNTHDPNAIAVYLEVPVLFGLFGSTRKQIGYIKADTAKSLAKQMDEGENVHAVVKSYWAPEDKEHPRVTLEISDEI